MPVDLVSYCILTTFITLPWIYMSLNKYYSVCILATYACILGSVAGNEQCKTINCDLGSS